jgi:putative DNA primase/helicase
LLACFNPRGPYPILLVEGVHGSGKTTLLKFIRACVDPRVANVEKIPRDDEQFFLAALNSWLAAFDNVSGTIPQWFSDSVCCVSTGAAYGLRKFYNQDQRVIYRVERPQAFTGIGDIINKPDALDRVWVVRITKQKLKQIKKLAQSFEALRPRILGELLSIVAHILKEQPEIERRCESGEIELPRMADAAVWVMSAEKVFDWEAGWVSQALKANTEELTAVAISSHPVVHLLRGVIKPGEIFDNQIGDLLSTIKALDMPASLRRYVPSSASALGQRIAQIEPELQRMGWRIERTSKRRQPNDKGTSKFVLIERPPDDDDHVCGAPEVAEDTNGDVPSDFSASNPDEVDES